MEDSTLGERLQLLRDRYLLLVGPLILLLGVGMGGSALLAWVAGISLVLLTVNKALPGRSRR